MRKRSRLWLLLVGVMCLLPRSAVLGAQQDLPTLLYAAVDGGELYLTRDLGGTRQGIADDAQAYLNIVWDPATLFLAFTMLDDRAEFVLGLTYNDGYATWVVDRGVEPGLPPSFSTIGRELTYAKTTGTGAGEMPTAQIYTLPRTGGDPQLVGAVPYLTGCGGGGLNAIEQVYFHEADAAPKMGIHRGVLHLTPYGIVHSNSCIAVTTLLTDPQTGASVELGTDLSYVTVSPDGTRAAGISGGWLTVVDLETQQAQTLETRVMPHSRIIWSRDDPNVLYFNGRVTTAKTLPVSAEQRAAFGAAIGDMPLTVYDSMIVRYNLATGDETLLYRGEAYAIGRMYLTDANELVFSQINTPRAWFETMLAGTITAPTDGQDYLSVSLMRLDLTSGAAQLAVPDVRQATLNLNAAFG